jgi:hypothetical protein
MLFNNPIRLIQVTGGSIIIVKNNLIALPKEAFMSFRVKNVISGDSFEVSPKWKWNGDLGSGVKLAGYDASLEGEAEFHESRCKLSDLILSKKIELKNPKVFYFNRVICDCYLNGFNVADLLIESESRPE